MSAATILTAGLTREELIELVAPICAAHRCSLVTLEFGTDRTLRVLIEREGIDGPTDGGVTLDDCQRVSRDVSAALDVNDPPRESPPRSPPEGGPVGSYRLEVSSPGLNRPLVSERDFRRFVGTRAKLEVREPIDGRKRFDGRIESVDSGSLVFLQDDKKVALRIDDIARAHVVWEPPARGNPRSPRKSS